MRGPQFIATSATIANPAEHFTLLTGLPATVVTDDGSPHGPRPSSLWNPPFVDKTQTARRSANHEPRALRQPGLRRVRTIAFTRACVIAELLPRYARQHLGKTRRSSSSGSRPTGRGTWPRTAGASSVTCSGAGWWVTATTAPELGIDVGGLDALLLVGFPGTIAFSGSRRARGRGSDPSSRC